MTDLTPTQCLAVHELMHAAAGCLIGLPLGLRIIMIETGIDDEGPFYRTVPLELEGRDLVVCRALRYQPGFLLAGPLAHVWVSPQCRRVPHEIQLTHGLAMIAVASQTGFGEEDMEDLSSIMGDMTPAQKAGVHTMARSYQLLTHWLSRSPSFVELALAVEANLEAGGTSFVCVEQVVSTLAVRALPLCNRLATFPPAAALAAIEKEDPLDASGWGEPLPRRKAG